MSKKILMLVGDFTEDYETMVPFHALQMLGYQVDSVSPGKKAGDTVLTAVHDFEGRQIFDERVGHKFAITADFDSVDTKDYAGFYITGGRSPEYLRLNERVLEITQEFFADNKPVAAICHAVQVLNAAGVMKGRRTTCFPSVAPDVRMAGAEYVAVADDEAVVDGNLVSSPAWPGNPAILREFIKLLGAQYNI